MRYKIYASDEGFGHLVRQQAIYEELKRLCPEIQATLQTQFQMPAARSLFGDIEFIEKFNNVTWSKRRDGTPDLPKIRAFYADYIHRSDEFIRREQGIDQFQFVVSDFVYEAFPVAVRHNIPAFGIAHHTWDWFFSKLYPLPVATNVLERLYNHALSADILFFPPFTPHDILDAYASKIKQVPLIVRSRDQRISIETKEDFKILIMDSSTKLLSARIKPAVRMLSDLPDIHFFVPEYLGAEADNVTSIGHDEVLLDYMPHMDLVIARAGFNTISECVAHRVPLLLIGEASNPEMDSNMLALKQTGLASFISIQSLSENFKEVVRSFIDNEYKVVARHMQEHEMECDGARVVAEDILNFVAGS